MKVIRDLNLGNITYNSQPDSLERKGITNVLNCLAAKVISKVFESNFQRRNVDILEADSLFITCAFEYERSTTWYFVFVKNYSTPGVYLEYIEKTHHVSLLNKSIEVELNRGEVVYSIEVDNIDMFPVNVSAIQSKVEAYLQSR